MRVLAWREEYGIGVASIDNAHRELFDLARRMASETEPAKVREALSFLRSYAVSHFEDEETWMERTGHAGLAAHARQHRIFREISLPMMEGRLMEDNFGESSRREFADFLGSWLVGHIMVYDRRIGQDIQP